MGDYMAQPALTLDEYQARVGNWTTQSAWQTIDQTMIDRFADLTGDHQFIHVDPVKAAATPMGGTVAHGFLTLSLLGGLGLQMVAPLAGMVMSINYGFDKLRFLAPVPCNSRIRGCFGLAAIESKSPNQHLLRFTTSVEIEGGAKPALVAEWLVMMVTA